MRTYFYDVESFPNLFTVTFLEDNPNEDIFTQYVMGDGQNDFKKLNEFLSNEIPLVGFNSLSYDNPVIRYIQNFSGNVSKLPEKIYKLSQRLIDDKSRRDDDIRELRYPRNATYNWKSIDLFKVLH